MKEGLEKEGDWESLTFDNRSTQCTSHQTQQGYDTLHYKRLFLNYIRFKASTDELFEMSLLRGSGSVQEGWCQMVFSLLEPKNDLKKLLNVHNYWHLALMRD